MEDIFLSYASEDRARIEPLVERLQAEGWSVRWDRELVAGPSFAEKIQEALEAVVSRAMAIRPDARFPDADAFSAALQVVVDTGTVPTEPTVKPNAAEAALLRRQVRAQLEKSLARLGRRRGGGHRRYDSDRTAGHAGR